MANKKPWCTHKILVRNEHGIMVDACLVLGPTYITTSFETQELIPEDAERIVACVNAMADIEDQTKSSNGDSHEVIA